MNRPPGHNNHDQGETLVELIVSIAILGLTGVSVMAMIFLSIQSSVQDRNQAQSGAYVRSAAETIQDKIDHSGSYASCASALTTYQGLAGSTSNLPSGFSATVLQVQSWKGGGVWGACDAKGIQRIQIQITSNGSGAHQAVETLYVVLRQPCSKAGANPCS